MVSRKYPTLTRNTLRTSFPSSRNTLPLRTSSPLRTSPKDAINLIQYLSTIFLVLIKMHVVFNYLHFFINRIYTVIRFPTLEAPRIRLFFKYTVIMFLTLAMNKPLIFPLCPTPEAPRIRLFLSIRLLYPVGKPLRYRPLQCWVVRPI